MRDLQREMQQDFAESFYRLLIGEMQQISPVLRDLLHLSCISPASLLQRCKSLCRNFVPAERRNISELQAAFLLTLEENRRRFYGFLYLGNFVVGAEKETAKQWTKTEYQGVQIFLELFVLVRKKCRLIRINGCFSKKHQKVVASLCRDAADLSRT